MYIQSQCCRHLLMCQCQAVSCCIESMLAAVLAVIPVQEEEREGAHDEEEEDPYPEAGVVFDCLVTKGTFY